MPLLASTFERGTTIVIDTDGAGKLTFAAQKKG
jgi:hypothetical protein